LNHIKEKKNVNPLFDTFLSTYEMKLLLTFYLDRKKEIYGKCGFLLVHFRKNSTRGRKEELPLLKGATQIILKKYLF
jgi:hypothetical protein